MKTLYILYKDDKWVMTHSDLNKALEWRKRTSNSVLYKATLEEIKEMI